MRIEEPDVPPDAPVGAIASYGVVRRLFETLVAQAGADARAKLLKGAAAHRVPATS